MWFEVWFGEPVPLLGELRPDVRGEVRPHLHSGCCIRYKFQRYIIISVYIHTCTCAEDSHVVHVHVHIHVHVHVHVHCAAFIFEQN